ncbi:hypothetical protein [Neptuniibacter sp. QD37_11]|uniref:hypothetical protein n=1 Tax=Neptuniibacter sp. QD37_11 TaxID=3398209 RepID=UPI0039F5E7D1
MNIDSGQISLNIKDIKHIARQLSYTLPSDPSAKEIRDCLSNAFASKTYRDLKRVLVDSEEETELLCALTADEQSNEPPLLTFLMNDIGCFIQEVLGCNLLRHSLSSYSKRGLQSDNHPLTNKVTSFTEGREVAPLNHEQLLNAIDHSLASSEGLKLWMHIDQPLDLDAADNLWAIRMYQYLLRQACNFCLLKLAELVDTLNAIHIGTYSLLDQDPLESQKIIHGIEEEAGFFISKNLLSNTAHLLP